MHENEKELLDSLDEEDREYEDDIKCTCIGLKTLQMSRMRIMSADSTDYGCR